MLAVPAAGAFAPAAAQAQTPPDEEAFIGSWMGTTEVGGAEDRVPLRIGRTEGGTLTAFGWARDEFGGDRRLNVSRVTIRGDSLILEAKRTGLQFAGALSADGSEIEGAMTLPDGRSLPVTFSPADGSVSVPPPRPQRPEADPADVRSIEAIVRARHEAASAAAGEEPAWDRFRSLFLPEARLTTTFRPPGGPPQVRTGTVEEWIETSGERLQAQGGFHVKAVHLVTERYGDIAHVFATYEVRDPAGASEPTDRGVETLQLWHDGDRWWIVSMMWQAERGGAPIPERYSESHVSSPPR